MAAPGIPQSFTVQQSNGQVLVSWALSVGATQYLIQRSLDNVTFTPLATVSGSPLATSYLDTAVTLGVQYWYKVAASNGTDTSSYTNSASAIPAPTGEMTLADIRQKAKERADRVNSNFVTDAEWRGYINQAMFELYDLLVTVFEDYFSATPVQFNTDGSTFIYPVPNGSNTFQNALTNATFTPPAMYKLLGVDLALQNAQNAYVSIPKFQFAQRNNFVFPNTASTIYGVFNMRYRMMGNNIEFIPTPTSGQKIRLWYVPRLTELLKDTDTTTQGVSGWIEYVIVRAAKYALDKEESDTTKLDQELLFLKARIEESAANRDAGSPDRISDSRTLPWGAGFGDRNGGTGGWALAPILAADDITHRSLVDAVFVSQPLLSYAALSIAAAYFVCLVDRNFSGGILFATARDFVSRCLTAFTNHVVDVILSRTQKQMLRVYAQRVVAGVAHVQAVYDRAIKQLVRYASRCVPLAFYRKSGSRVLRVFSAAHDGALPKPAGIRFIYLGQESAHHIHVRRVAQTGRGSK